MKNTFYTEIAYLVGIIALSFGTALMAKADFGMAMIVAPAYLLHLKISPYLPFFSFGVAEYCMQALLLIILAITVRKFKRSFLLSFVTTVIYGLLLDLFMWVTGFIPFATNIWVRIACFAFGFVSCVMGIVFFFKTYLPPEAYELFVKEISLKYGFAIYKVKTVYDFSSLIISVLLSILLFGFNEFGIIGWGTLFCALFYGVTIGKMSKALDSIYEFKDLFNFRSFFEK